MKVVFSLRLFLQPSDGRRRLTEIFGKRNRQLFYKEGELCWNEKMKMQMLVSHACLFIPRKVNIEVRRERERDGCLPPPFLPEENRSAFPDKMCKAGGETE